MSGIVGILRTDGAPVAPALLSALTESLAFRGPDAKGVWREGPVAFGHTLLRTTYEAECEEQPLSLNAAADASIWIVADARIDARDELISNLAGDCARELQHAPDVELILRAYLRWGEGCVEHLLGDFAFAIWDGRTRRLFCARDHMGVKPFYYAQVGPWLVLSNTLECVRQHPAVSDRLDDLAVADFLLFGANQDNATTTYYDIKRLPPAHTLTWSAQGLGIRRYWSLPIDEPVYYRRDRDYIDRFNELVHQAVSDRLRTDRVGVFMSGGLDSTLLAATASRLLSTGSSPVHAFTFVYDSLIPDPERAYAEAAARHLDVPLHFCVSDEQIGWARPGDQKTPEPVDDVVDRRSTLPFYSKMAAHSRVFFHGEGPDNALHYEWRPHLTHLYRRRRWGRLVADVTKHMWSHKRIPLLPTIPRMIRDRQASEQYEAVFPAWLNPELIDRLDLRERWLQGNSKPPSPHPVRPTAYASLLTPLWTLLFESFEPSSTGVVMEARHPHVDIRLLRFMLSLPALPWCREKHIVRCATRGLLPEAVRVRPKTPLNGHPECEQVKLHGMPPVFPAPALEPYADVTRFFESAERTVTSVQSDLRLVAFSYWLRDRESVGSSQGRDEQYEVRGEVVGSERR